MSNVSQWSVIAGNNTDPPPDGAPENMPRNTVNNTMREMMSALARWYQDNRAGSLVTTNTANAYALTSNTTYASLADVGTLTFRVNAANTGAVTLDIDGLGAQTWQRRSGVAYSSGDLIADQLVTVAYNETNLVFETVGGVSANEEFAVGDSIMEMQASASIGWTKDTTAALDNVALRLVSTTAVTNKTNGISFTATLGSRAILETNLPSHNHSNGSLSTASNGGHTHSLNNATGIVKGNSSDNDFNMDIGSAHNTSVNISVNSVGNHTHTINGSTANTGGNTPMDFAVNYRDVIKVNKA